MIIMLLVVHFFVYAYYKKFAIFILLKLHHLIFSHVVIGALIATWLLLRNFLTETIVVIEINVKNDRAKNGSTHQGRQDNRWYHQLQLSSVRGKFEL